MNLQSTEFKTATAAFRDKLLRLTIDWCRENSPFYQQRLPLAAKFDGLQSLHALPLLRREDILNNHSEFLCDAGPPASVQYTTGTTGTFLPLYRNQAELAFIEQFYTANLQSRNIAADTKRPLHLSLSSAYHGAPTPIPSASYVLSAGVYDRTQANQAVNLLKNTFSFEGVEKRVSGIVGGDLAIKALTAFLMDEGIDPSEFAVRNLVFTGGYTSTKTKNNLAKIWKATVVDRYSLSEVFGGATQPTPGAPFSFDIEVIPEVIDPFSLKPVSSGVGVLVLTSLYPFSQMMPVIRYYTGDLVEKVPGKEDGEEFVVHLLGRERRSIIESHSHGTKPLVLAGNLHETLEALPDVAASPRYRGLASDLAMEFAGKLHYKIENETQKNGQTNAINITIGLRYAPWIYPERTASIATQIRRQLYQASDTLAKRVKEGSLSLNLNFVRAEQVPPFTMK